MSIKMRVNVQINNISNEKGMSQCMVKTWKIICGMLWKILCQSIWILKLNGQIPRKTIYIDDSWINENECFYSLYTIQISNQSFHK